MATASSYRCMCISQWSILIAMLLVASIASAVVLGVGFILKQQSPQHCKPEASGMATNNTNRMQRGQLDLGDRNNFDMNVDIDSDYINGLKAFEKYNALECISYLESALKKYHTFQDTEYGCPQKCYNGTLSLFDRKVFQEFSVIKFARSKCSCIPCFPEFWFFWVGTLNQ